MHSRSTVLLGLADAFALPKDNLKLLNALSSFSVKILPDLFSFIQFTLQGDEALRMEKRRTL